MTGTERERPAAAPGSVERKHRYDLDLLQHRFDGTFEQVCYR